MLQAPFALHHCGMTLSSIICPPINDEGLKNILMFMLSITVPTGIPKADIFTVCVVQPA